MAGRSKYTDEAVKAAHCVLLELHRILGEYREDIVVVGGWVPELLLPGEHVGTMDVDLGLNHVKLGEAGYKSILQALHDAGYDQGKQPFIFLRKVAMGDREVEVQVDLLAGEYQGSGKRHRTQKVQDARARKARGCDLAFTMYSTVSITGELPGGGIDSAAVKVASIVPFLVMKGMAMHDRLKPKDAFDVYFCVKNYPGGTGELAQEFLPCVSHALVREGLEKIAGKFASPEHVGPCHVADFDEIVDPEDRAIRQRDAYELVAELLHCLGFD